MAAHSLLLSLLLLLTQAIPAHADLKIATHRGTISDTRYIQGRNSRTEIGDAFGPHLIWIYNGDRQILYTLDPSTRTYGARSVAPMKPNPLLRVRESGKTVDIYRDYVDTGERRWLFGHLARHIIQTERRVPEAGSCSAKEGETRTKTDGWYVDLSGPLPGAAYRAVAGGMACADGAIDRLVIHATGHSESGFPVLETTTRPDWPRATSRMRVVECDESPLDPKTFLPPADFREELSMPDRRRDGFLDILRYRLSNFVIAAEDFLD